MIAKILLIALALLFAGCIVRLIEIGDKRVISLAVMAFLCYFFTLCLLTQL